MDRSYLEVYERGLKKVNLSKDYLNDFPHITKNGKWLKHKDGHWTGGFWVGLLWLEAMKTQRNEDFIIAKEWAMRFKDRMFDNKTHDQGFIFGPSCVMGYNILKDGDCIPLIHAGANNLLDLYNKETGLILAWDEPNYQGIAIVDTIMNLSLLWISDSLKSENNKKEILKIVADNIERYHIRDDFSTIHVAKWDDEYTISPSTHQGATANSCWSRGQAWALYGYANLYRYSGDKHYLDLAIKLAEYFYKNLNKNHLPAWDFIYRDKTNYPIDAAAASIAASGMLLISILLKLNNNMEESEYWKRCAKNILNAEIDQCFYTKLNQYGIIEKVVIDYPRRSGIGESSTYGDYYFMEALYRLLNIENYEKTFVLY